MLETKHSQVVVETLQIETKFWKKTKVTAYAKLLGTLQIEASRHCPAGSRCEGFLTISGGPVVTDGVREEDGRQIYGCLVSLLGEFSGECSRARAREEDENYDEDTDTCITANDVRTFLAKVAELPEKPAEPSGTCRLYRDQIGHAFPYPICAGECERGDCKTIVSVRGERIKAQCDCS